MSQDFNPEDELFLDHMAALTLQWPGVSCSDCLVTVLGPTQMERVILLHNKGSRHDAALWLTKRANAMFSGRRKMSHCFDRDVISSEYKPFMF